jgi:prostaglandin-endoperoxide synthase 2
MPDGSTTAARPATAPARDRSRDGFRNKVEFALLSGFRPFWEFVNARPALARPINGLVVNNATRKVPARPLALSTAAPYASWTSLNDRGWFGRYLPPRPAPDLPPLDRVLDLFRPGPGGPKRSSRSTLVFPSFAQWFTDGFLMTADGDRRRTSSNHQIDLSQVYGLTPDVTRALRLLSEKRGEKGRLKSVVADGEEWAPKLYDEAGSKRAEFGPVPRPERMPDNLPAERKSAVFAFGGGRANATLFTAMVNTLFLREHNRLCGVLEAANPDWDDERVFETARNVNIVLLIKVVVEEYINHISPYWFRLLGDPRPCYKAAWNRQNWIPIEFNLLYRWHSSVPETASWDGAPVPVAEMRFDNRFLLRAGLGAAFDNANRTEAGQIGLFNTPDFLLAAEEASVAQGRRNELASYNDYREAMGYPRVTRFEQITGDPRAVAGLREVYGHVDRVEFFVGLFAEEPRERAAVPSLIGRMVAADAFSHALTNPLLSPRVFNEDTFTQEGMAAIAATSTLQHLLDRNTGRPAGAFKASMEQGR